MSFLLWESVSRLSGEAERFALGVPPGPSECGVLLQGCPGAICLLKTGAREDKARSWLVRERERARACVYGCVCTCVCPIQFLAHIRNQIGLLFRFGSFPWPAWLPWWLSDCCGI